MVTQTSIRSIGPLKDPSPLVPSSSTWSPFLITNCGGLDRSVSPREFYIDLLHVDHPDTALEI